VSAIVIWPAVTETVAGLLLPNWSLTMSWATYVPATSGTNVANSVFAPVSLALLPPGMLRDHEYPVIGTPFGSVELAPLSCAIAPINRLGVVVVGTAIGGVLVLVMVIVAAGLERNPLETISCAAYVPGRSTMKVGF
jgi:hypothetical protein